MSKKSSNWYVPPDIALLLSLSVVPLILGVIAAVGLPVLSRFKSGEVVGVFYSALGLGAVGAAVLFIAKLPLYRKRQFFTFGPGKLDAIHRRFYLVAYVFVAASVLLLVLIWLRLK